MSKLSEEDYKEIHEATQAYMADPNQQSEEFQLCALCGSKPVRMNPNFPKYVCTHCMGNTIVDEAGRILKIEIFDPRLQGGIRLTELEGGNNQGELNTEEFFCTITDPSGKITRRCQAKKGNDAGFFIVPVVSTP